MDTTMMGQHLHEINSGNVSDFIHKLHIALFGMNGTALIALIRYRNNGGVCIRYLESQIEFQAPRSHLLSAFLG